MKSEIARARLNSQALISDFRRETSEGMANWIQSFEGRKVTPLALSVEQVGSIEEIALMLSRRFRFSGATVRPYSVAEHCVRGADELPAAFTGAFLLHELSEVYLPDVLSPIKPALCVEVPEHGGTRTIPWAKLEREHTRVMLAALGLESVEPLIYSPEVRRMDLAMLATEARDLMGPAPEPWGLEVEPLPMIIPTWAGAGPNHAATDWAQAFVNAFRASFS